MIIDRKKPCPMRHPVNGNCLPHGGFCLDAVSDSACESMHRAYERGYAAALRQYIQQGMKSPCSACGYGGKYLDAPPCAECPAHPKTSEKNESLTLDELRTMDGQPVWLDDSPNGWKCFIVNLEFPVPDGRVWIAPCGVDAHGMATSLSLLAECGLYRHPPKEV